MKMLTQTMRTMKLILILVTLGAMPRYVTLKP